MFIAHFKVEVIRDGKESNELGALGSASIPFIFVYTMTIDGVPSAVDVLANTDTYAAR